MKILIAFVLLAVRWSGSPSPAGPAGEALTFDAEAVCAAIQADAGVESEPMGSAWRPGSQQTGSCWNVEIAR